MVPMQGQHVKCVMKNSFVIEGIVQDWSEKEVVLKSLDEKNLMIIHHPNDDIVMTKIMLDVPQTQEELSPKNEVVEEKPLSKLQEEIKSSLNDVLSEDNEDLKVKNLSNLRQLVIHQEKKIIESRKKEHFGTAGNAKMTQYSSPYQPAKIPSWAYGNPPKSK